MGKGMVFTGTGKGSGKFTWGLFVSHLSQVFPHPYDIDIDFILDIIIRQEECFMLIGRHGAAHACSFVFFGVFWFGVRGTTSVILWLVHVLLRVLLLWPSFQPGLSVAQISLVSWNAHDSKELYMCDVVMQHLSESAIHWGEYPFDILYVVCSSYHSNLLGTAYSIYSESAIHWVIC